jgi:hypothetical protein
MKETIMSLFDILNNSSVAAFAGAFFAFWLVVANDWRRNGRKKKLIKREIDIIKRHAINKIETVKSNRSLLREHNKIVPAPIMKFPVHILNQLTVEVIDRLTIDQKSTIDAIAYTMEAIDELLQSAYNITKQIMIMGKEDTKKIEYIERLLVDFEDALVNLGRLSEMCQKYIDGQYREIITKQYRREDYIQ